MSDESEYDLAHDEHDRLLPEWARRISGELRTLMKEIRKLTDDQAKLDADVQALNDGLTNIEAEIASLKNQPAAATLDFTALDAAVARIKGDETAPPAPVVAPTPAPAVDPNGPAAPTDPNAPTPAA